MSAKPLATYSFLDVHCRIAGPGGSVDIGSSAALAKEGITFESIEDVDVMVIGAAGDAMHGLRGVKAARAVIRVLKTSPANAQLGAMLSYQRQSALFHGQNQISLANPVAGDSYTCTGVAFARVPTNTWAEDPGMIEWTFNVSYMDPKIGGGLAGVIQAAIALGGLA